jgi:hypothetical protein
MESPVEVKRSVMARGGKRVTDRNTQGEEENLKAVQQKYCVTRFS